MKVIEQVTSGPTQRDLEQMAERDIQMAAYLATNPNSVTGLPQRQAQEILRDGPGIDQGMPSRYDDREVRYDYDERLFQGQGTVTASSLRDTNFNLFDHFYDYQRSRHGSGDSDWVIRTNHGTR
jgi:hypothetical protein